MKKICFIIFSVCCIFGSLFNEAFGSHTFRLVTLGDSITKGVREGVVADQTFAALVEKELIGKGIKAEIINLGVGGERTDQALKRLERDVLSLKPDCVTVMYGTNDAFIDHGKSSPRLSIEQYENNLRQIVAQLRQKGIQPVLMTEPPLGSFNRVNEEPYKSRGGNFKMIPYMEACRRVADAENIPLVDNFRHWAEQALTGQDIDAWMTDGCHPDPEGHRVIARTILKVLERHVSIQPKGYTIPTIDLTHEKRRQIVVDREPGQYLGHVTTLLLEDNKTILCVYPKGHGGGAIVMKKSTDSGLTWSDRLPVPENWATSKEVPTLHRVIDPPGKKRIIMFSGLYPIRMAVSEDDGGTWTPLESIGDFGGIVTMGDVVRLKNGNYMALFHDDGRFLHGSGIATNKFHVFKTVSADGGLNWNAPVVIIEHPTAHLCEPGVARSPDGGQLAMLMRENSRRFNSFVSFSNDEGETWSKSAELPASLTGDRHTCRYAPDGRLVIVFRDTTRESPTKGDFVAWVGKYEDIVNGDEGQYRIRLLDNTRGGDCGYPGLEVLPDGTFAATTYGHWIEGEQPFIMSVRFTLEGIDKKAAELEVK